MHSSSSRCLLQLKRFFSCQCQLQCGTVCELGTASGKESICVQAHPLTLLPSARSLTSHLGSLVSHLAMLLGCPWPWSPLALQRAWEGLQTSACQRLLPSEYFLATPWSAHPTCSAYVGVLAVSASIYLNLTCPSQDVVAAPAWLSVCAGPVGYAVPWSSLSFAVYRCPASNYMPDCP